MTKSLIQRDSSGLISHTIRYPRIASSTGLAEYIEKYDLNTTLSTWSEAVQSANVRNGHFGLNWFCRRKSNNMEYYYKMHRTGVSPEGQLVEYSWIGATDNEDQNGSTWDEEDNQMSDLTSILQQVKAIGSG